MAPPYDPWASEPEVARRLDDAHRAQERVLAALERAREEASLGGLAPEVDAAIGEARAEAEESLRRIHHARRAVARSWGGPVG